MKKSYIIFLHLGYWAIYLLLLLVIFSIVQLQVSRTIAFPLPLFFSPFGAACIIPNVFTFYSFYLLLFPRFLKKRKTGLLILSGIAVCAVWAVAGGLMLGLLFGYDQPVFRSFEEFFGLALCLFLIACIHGGTALVLHGFITWYDETKLREELQRKNHEMEMALIRSQLDPHFLFNTINNIDVLITRDAARASDYLNKLSDIMRYMLYETGAEKIMLARELEYIEKYLELQKIRTSNPDYVHYTVSGDPGGKTIAPILFFPFIENAFKHTENKKSANSIRINITIENAAVLFECENSYQKSHVENKQPGGLGNELIAKRLELLYGSRHSLKVDDSGNTYRVKLSIDIK
jgi:hypothetical protein